MKRLILPLALIGAGLCSPAAHATPAECFAKPSAVFAAHPTASHASYVVRNRSERCWYADAFRTEAKSQPHHVAVSAPAPQPRTTAAAAAPAPHTAAIAPAPQPRNTAVAPVPQPSTTAIAPAPERHTRGIARAVQPVAIDIPAHNPRVSQIARGMNWISGVDESPTDFEGRFSVTGYSVIGYRVPK